MVPKRYKIYFIGQIILIKVVDAGLDPRSPLLAVEANHISFIDSFALSVPRCGPDRCDAASNGDHYQ
jgi:hypothetical protein